MRRAWSILLLLAFAALGSGALRYLHELAHAAEHAHAVEHADTDGGASEHHPDPDHDHAPLGDPEDCFTHAQLKLPMLPDGYAPRLACLGLTGVLPGNLPTPTVRSRRPVLELNSRAPPAC